ncbi:MAG: hypothetical protein M3N48_05620 [Verrucomicrobiota bacterium]|nr:hypothetical protein [Verrucomicrobiota bacterium]
MHHRSIAVLAIVFIAFGGEGCASNSNRSYQEVLLPLQTGSVLQRRVFVRSERDKSPTKKKKKETSTRKPDAEPSATPAREEENTPPVERFR